MDEKETEPALDSVGLEFCLKEVVQNAPVSFMVMDSEARILSVNRSGRRLLGATDTENLIGRSILPCLDQSTHDWMKSTLGEVLNGKDRRGIWTLINFAALPSDVESFFSPIHDQSGKVSAVLVVSRNITEQFSTAHHPEDSTYRLQSMIRSLSEGIVVISRDLKITEVNQSAERILGYSREFLIGRNPFQDHWNSIHEDGRPFLPSESPSLLALQTGIPQHDVVLGIKLCDRTVWISINAQPLIREGESEPFAVVVSFTDSTLRRELAEKERILREKLTHALRVNTLGEMSTGLAHEVAQPLTAIAVLCSSLRKLLPQLHGPGLQELEQTLGQVIQQSVRAGDVVRRLRGLIRRNQTEFISCNPNDLVKEALQLMAFELGLQHINVTFVPRCGVSDVLVDSIQTQQVLINLIRNAMDALGGMPEHERNIAIRVESSPEDQQDQVISVMDTGPGIPESIREEIFESYVSTKPDGLGLGLPICRTIIENQGGSLWVHASAPGHTEFRFSLRKASFMSDARLQQ